MSLETESVFQMFHPPSPIPPSTQKGLLNCNQALCKLCSLQETTIPLMKL